MSDPIVDAMVTVFAVLIMMVVIIVPVLFIMFHKVKR